MDAIMEVFGALGAPARMFGRLPLITRYFWTGLASPWFNPKFAQCRFGHYTWRPWLLFDMQELQMLEELVNKASDARVEQFRQHQLESLNMVSVVTALVSGIALTALQLPSMEQTSYLGRGCFSVSMIISLLATFFACLQQRTYGFIEEPGAIRAWLSNGIRYQNAEGREALQASIVSHNLLQAPFELLCISITTFIMGFAVHLGSAYVEKVPLGVEESIGNRGVLIAFCIGTAFALGLLGQVLGGKDVERNKFLKKLAKDGTAVVEPISLEIPSYAPMSAGVSPGGITWDGPHPSIKMDMPLPKVPEETSLEVPGLENGVSANLAVALQQATAAHRACAEAEAEVARWYQQLSSSQ